MEVVHTGVMMLPELTLATALTQWRFGDVTTVVAVFVGGAYVSADRRNPVVSAGRRASFLGLGVGVWLLTNCSFIGVYADTLFWVRALQVVLLMMVVPFGLAMGRPLTVFGGGTGGRIDTVLGTRGARIAMHPAATSVMMLAVPWLLFLTPWLHAVLVDPVVDSVTRMLLIAIGFAYFYARLQADPVPRRYSQLISLVITIAEMLGDGVLGVVLWLGPTLQVQYYTGLGRTWGPSITTDQIIGAGVFWILGDVLGLPFLMTLLRAFSADEHVKSVRIDAELDAEPESPVSAAPWWLNDPQLEERFKRL